MRICTLALICAILVSSAVFSADIHEAAKKGDIEQIRKILDENPEFLDVLDRSGFTPLHWAVIYDRKDMIEHLIGKGADIKGNNKALRGWMPLQSALFAYNNDVSDILVAHEALEELDPEEEMLYLFLAASAGNASLIAKLLENGTPASARNKYGGNPSS